MTGTVARLADPAAALAEVRRLAPTLAERAGAHDVDGRYPAGDIADLEAAGTAATRRGHPLERIFRDARCGSLQPATSDVCVGWLGAAALGLAPDSAGEVPRW